jgi:hypothetical protein
MVTAVYALCALTSLACAVQLLRAYRVGRVSLLLWTALCFCGLAANNLLMLLDVLLQLDIAGWRKLPALAGVMLLLHGLISDSR